MGWCVGEQHVHFISTSICCAACIRGCLQIEHPVTKQVFRFWFESPVVSMPTKDDAPPGADTRLYPRDCREAVSGSHVDGGPS
jgi:hypothetical protein